MNRVDAQGSVCTGPLHLAAIAINDAQGHLRDYADATDDPEPEAVEAADRLDSIVALLASIGQKVDLLPESVNGHAAALLYVDSSGIGGGDGSR